LLFIELVQLFNHGPQSLLTQTRILANLVRLIRLLTNQKIEIAESLCDIVEVAKGGPTRLTVIVIGVRHSGLRSRRIMGKMQR
jgi:hypothetical protein